MSHGSRGAAAAQTSDKHTELCINITIKNSTNKNAGKCTTALGPRAPHRCEQLCGKRTNKDSGNQPRKQLCAKSAVNNTTALGPSATSVRSSASSVAVKSATDLGPWCSAAPGTRQHSLARRGRRRRCRWVGALRHPGAWHSQQLRGKLHVAERQRQEGGATAAH